MASILGAGGAIGSALSKSSPLATNLFGWSAGTPNRSPARRQSQPISRTLTTRLRRFLVLVAFLLVGLKYDITVWQALWPRIMGNAIEAAKRANAKLVFFDNVYMYGKVEGAMAGEALAAVAKIVRRASLRDVGSPLAPICVSMKPA